MPDLLLNVGDHLLGIGFIPAPIEVFGRDPELDDEVGGEVLGLDFTALLAPEAEQGGFIIAHDDPRVRTADEIPAIRIRSCPQRRSHRTFSILKGRE